MCSDGLLDAEDHEQGQFGEERFLQVFKETRLSNRFAEILKAVDKHRDGAAQFDDITLVCVDCFDKDQS